MAFDGFTIRIYVPDGDPDGVRIIDRMASTGLAISFPRAQWPRIKSRPEFERAGIYVLTGYKAEDTDLPTLYIGQGDGVLDRIDSHFDKKDFWDWGFAFVTKSNDSGFNRAHITWLEHMLITRARQAGRSHLDYSNTPGEPTLSEADKADTNLFLKEILQVQVQAGFLGACQGDRADQVCRCARRVDAGAALHDLCAVDGGEEGGRFVLEGVTRDEKETAIPDIEARR
jgi:hypothetical protein